MRRRCKSLAEGAWAYNPGTGESKNPMAMQVHHREWLALASLLYYILRCRIHRLEVLANSDQRGDWCKGSTATTGRYRSYRREMGVRVPRLFPQITFGFGWRHNDASTLFLFSVLLVCEDRLISCF